MWSKAGPSQPVSPDLKHVAGGPRRAPSAPPRLPPAVHGHLTSRRLRRESRLARIYDAEILPGWADHFGRLLLRNLPLPVRGTMLDVLCCTGATALECMDRGGEGLRVVAIDPSSAMLDEARRKAGAAAGRRIFFKSQPAEPRLAFDEDVYELVLSNLGLTEVDDPRRLLGEMVRVAKPGAQVAATLPLLGTFGEFHEILSAALLTHGIADAAGRLEAAVRTPAPDEALGWLRAAGAVDVHLVCEHVSLLFAGGRDFLFAPVIEYGPLPAWREVAGGHGPAMQDIFLRAKDEIDRRVRREGLFEVTVRAGCLIGRKPDVE